MSYMHLNADDVRVMTGALDKHAADLEHASWHVGSPLKEQHAKDAERCTRLARLLRAFPMEGGEHEGKDVPANATDRRNSDPEHQLPEGDFAARLRDEANAIGAEVSLRDQP